MGLSAEVRRIRVSDDGPVFILFDNTVHRYRLAGGATCALTPDTSFGVGGALEDSFVDSFDLVASGRLATKTFTGLDVYDQYTGTKLYSCEGQNVGRLAVSSDGRTVYALSETEPAESIKFVLGAGSCTSVSPWVPSTPYATDETGYAESVVVQGDRLVVGAQAEVLIYALDGTLESSFGKSQSPTDWKSSGIAYLNDVVVTSEGFDIVDTNEPGLHRFDSGGQFVEFWSLADLIGGPDGLGTLGPRPLAMGVAPGGERYLAVEADTQQIWRLPSF